MKQRELVIGEYLPDIKCISVIHSHKIRVRPLGGQGITTAVFIECSVAQRKAYPVGTKFIAKSPKVVQKYGVIHLRAQDQWIEKI